MLSLARLLSRSSRPLRRPAFRRLDVIRSLGCREASVTQRVACRSNAGLRDNSYSTNESARI